jgi:butyryl-CoA dehydrogenase
MLATKTQLAPRRAEIDFQLYDVLYVEEMLALPQFSDHDRSTLDSILDTAYDIAGDYYAPTAAALDAFDFQLENHAIATPPYLKAATDAYVENGFMGMGFASKDGGLQLPATFANAASLVFSASNGSANGYTFLTIGAAHLLAEFANDEQRKTWMEPMVEGRYFGTMALSEPQAGSSLADVATKAWPAGDGTYRLSGNKMWISGAEHDLAENIVNLVLAKLPDAPPGVKGISLFIVPKYLVNPDGSIGKRNGAYVTGINHKLGQRGIINTVLTLGEPDECVGYLVGKPHDGMREMFHMMNEARIAIGAWAASSSIAAYEYSLEYAKDRPQGRLASNKDPLSPPVPIVEHADVRRMLLRQKALAEGSLALVLYCARLFDLAHASTNEDERAEASLLLDLLTPVAKTWPSERGVESTSLAIQVLGGYGYSPEYPVERHFRDQRLNPIHEGTTGIQGLDLLGRKVRLQDGALFKTFLAAIRSDLDRNASPEFASEEAALRDALARLERVTATLLEAQGRLGPDRALAEATDYLDAFGTIVVAWRWLVMGRVAESKSASDFHAGKVAACRYFFKYDVPEANARLERVALLDDTIFSVRPAML